jgi:co-chaperonin GroES (HSP10)
MSSSPVKPLGHHVLVEILPVQIKSSGGIILNSATEQERERKGRDIARIIAFGPTAYKFIYTNTDFNGPEDWGVKVGDIIELKTRYDGKFTRACEYSKEFENYRYVLDSDIIGLADGEFKAMLEDQ